MPKKEIFKRKLYALVEPVSYDDLKTQYFDFFDIFIVVLIILNVIAVIFQSVPQIDKNLNQVFHIFEVFSIIVFSVEYLTRLYCCTVNPKYAHPLYGRIKYIFSLLAIIDLLAILPFYLPMIISFDLRFLRAIRLLRLIRLFKFGRYSESLKLFGSVLKEKKSELVLTFIIIFILLIVSSGLLYQFEKDVQPDKFSSMPAAMWWGVVTLTTVGYGDVYPISTMGKIVGSVIAFLGIGLFALPTGILSAGFVEEMRKKKATERKCPHCGGKLDQ